MSFRSWALAIACAVSLPVLAGPSLAAENPAQPGADAVADQCVNRQGKDGTWRLQAGKWVKCSRAARAEPNVGGGNNFLPFLALPLTAGTLTAAGVANGRPFSP